MPSLKSIRTRIASVKSTQKITRAMKLVSAARLRRAQDAIVGARPYANALAAAMEIVLEIAGKKGRDFFRRRKLHIGHELGGPTAETAGRIADELGHIVTHAFKSGATDAVFLVYNEFKSAAQQKVVVEPLLPVTAATPPGRASAEG